MGKGWEPETGTRQGLGKVRDRDREDRKKVPVAVGSQGQRQERAGTGEGQEEQSDPIFFKNKKLFLSQLCFLVISSDKGIKEKERLAMSWTKREKEGKEKKSWTNRETMERRNKTKKAREGRGWDRAGPGTGIGKTERRFQLL